MTSKKDFIQVEVTDDADAVTSELYIENTFENLAFSTIEENHSSFVFENNEKVIKIETDIIDDYAFESTIEIIKNVDNQSNKELPLECQDVADTNNYLNHENTSDKIFCCYICGKSFDLNYHLKNHLEEHKRQVQYKNNECKFCGKGFKLKFGLNIHIEKQHSRLVNSNSTIVLNASQNSMANNCHILNIKQEKDKKHHSRLVNSNSTIVSNASQNSMANNCHILNIKQKKDIYTNFRERNSSDHLESVNSNASTSANEPHGSLKLQKNTNIHTLNMYKCNHCGQQCETNLALDNHIWEIHSDGSDVIIL